MKEAHFYLDASYPESVSLCSDYIATEKAFKDKVNSIHTTSIVQLSFDWIKYGYDLYLHYKDKCIRLRPFMDETDGYTGGKEIRIGHNLRRLVTGGVFNHDLGLE